MGQIHMHPHRETPNKPASQFTHYHVHTNPCYAHQKSIYTYVCLLLGSLQAVMFLLHVFSRGCRDCCYWACAYNMFAYKVLLQNMIFENSFFSHASHICIGGNVNDSAQIVLSPPCSVRCLVASSFCIV